jgi:hypothetical protein
MAITRIFRGLSDVRRADDAMTDELQRPLGQARRGNHGRVVRHRDGVRVELWPGVGVELLRAWRDRACGGS